MKKIYVLFAFSCFSAALFAQALPKKYVLIEHFTNSRCSICASKNPAFYTLIANYPNDVRHLSVHPPVPYSNCLIYLSNPTENNSRTNLYGINGTPRVALNGDLLPVSSQLLPQAKLDAVLNQESPIGIRVQESGTDPNKIVSITVTSYGTAPAGDYKIFAAVAESTVNYNSPNGESKHHDVFHAMLPSIDGEAFNLPAVGNSITFNYAYTHDSPNGWTTNYDSLYVLAFVQNTSTKEILNTGTRFDPLFTSASEATAPKSIRLQPNPAREEASVVLSDETVERVEVFGLDGRLVYSNLALQPELIRIPTADFTPGIYLVKMLGAQGIYVGKLVKE